VVVAACLLAVPAVALWLQTTGKRDAVDAGAETFESAAAVERSAAEPVPDLRDLMTELDLWNERVIDSIEETSVSLHYYSRSTDSLEPLLRALEFSPATMDRVTDTQAIDGTLTATAPHATASWTYHPHDGLSIVIQITN
jgi:hypothetical protein